MHKVKTLNNISDKGLGKFAPDGYELSDVHADPEAIVLRSHKLTANDITPSLMAVGRAGAGVRPRFPSIGDRYWRYLVLLQLKMSSLCCGILTRLRPLLNVSAERRDATVWAAPRL